ncbi:TetR/AcrR family transcriptional regulator [Mucilaginibacter sp. CAU 1740]|uniref:TetR/AcrR family transcriptional regulator n=1 Tax=Mucilaginibacter sp. CAU 1740 TaxID=3140365 RepID=UPI00325B097C
MATKKKRHKIRDPDETRRRLIEAVGAILEESGYTDIKVNAIARHLGRDKNLIRYYFDSLANLKKAYIHEKDYWPPFFERFRQDEPPDREQVKTLFTELMQENYMFFKDNPEMQRIIRWQISESNPLLRAISDTREANGDRLLELTDRYFRDTGINFRDVIALLLGGVYYIVLHARTNGSRVCGIDINNEEESRSLWKTIGVIVNWAFEAAAAAGNIL